MSAIARFRLFPEKRPIEATQEGAASAALLPFRATVRAFFNSECFSGKSRNPGARATRVRSLPGTFPASCELCLRAAHRSRAESVSSGIFFSFQGHPAAAHRIDIASHRIASHRIASHRIASHRIASHRIASIAALSARISDCKHTLRCRARAGTTHELRCCSAGCVCTTATRHCRTVLHATNARKASALPSGPRPNPAVTARPRAFAQAGPAQAG